MTDIYSALGNLGEAVAHVPAMKRVQQAEAAAEFAAKHNKVLDEGASPYIKNVYDGAKAVTDTTRLYAELVNSIPGNDENLSEEEYNIKLTQILSDKLNPYSQAYFISTFSDRLLITHREAYAKNRQTAAENAGKVLAEEAINTKTPSIVNDAYNNAPEKATETKFKTGMVSALITAAKTNPDAVKGVDIGNLPKEDQTALHDASQEGIKHVRAQSVQALNADAGALFTTWTNNNLSPRDVIKSKLVEIRQKYPHLTFKDEAKVLQAYTKTWKLETLSKKSKLVLNKTENQKVTDYNYKKIATDPHKVKELIISREALPTSLKNAYSNVLGKVLSDPNRELSQDDKHVLQQMQELYQSAGKDILLTQLDKDKAVAIRNIMEGNKGGLTLQSAIRQASDIALGNTYLPENETDRKAFVKNVDAIVAEFGKDTLSFRNQVRSAVTLASARGLSGDALQNDVIETVRRNTTVIKGERVYTHNIAFETRLGEYGKDLQITPTQVYDYALSKLSPQDYERVKRGTQEGTLRLSLSQDGSALYILPAGEYRTHAPITVDLQSVGTELHREHAKVVGGDTVDENGKPIKLLGKDATAVVVGQVPDKLVQQYMDAQDAEGFSAGANRYMTNEVLEMLAPRGSVYSPKQNAYVRKDLSELNKHIESLNVSLQRYSNLPYKGQRTEDPRTTYTQDELRKSVLYDWFTNLNPE